MAQFDINNFAIDRVIRGLMVSPSTGSVMWSINQITEPTLSITTEESEVVDAIGVPITSFNRAKRAEFSASNSLFDLSLFAAQSGKEKEIATSDNKVIMPSFETIVVPSTVTNPVTLKHKPTVTPSEIYKINGDGTLGEKLVYNASAESGKFTYDDEAHTITFPSDAEAGTKYFILYDYEAESGVGVIGDAVNFPHSGRFIMEVLGVDVCNPDVQVHAYVEYPNAKLDANVDVSFTTEGTHPFTIKAQQQYCDSNKILYKILIPDED